MKTKIVVRHYGEPERFERGFEPQDSPDGKSVPRYSAPHRARGWNGKAEEWDEPESVGFRSTRERPKKGKLQRIRIMPDVYVDSLAALDVIRDKLREELTRLNRQEQEILKTAYLVGKPMDIETIKGWTKDKTEGA